MTVAFRLAWRAMKTTRKFCLVLPLVLGACAADDAGSADGVSFEPVADVGQLMNTILEPAADFYWDAVGTIIDFSGTLEIAPSSDEEWELVRNSAYVIAESGNLLMMEGRGATDDTWRAMSLAMVQVGRLAIEAAEAKNTDAVFDAGAEVYAVCATGGARRQLLVDHGRWSGSGCDLTISGRRGCERRSRLSTSSGDPGGRLLIIGGPELKDRVGSGLGRPTGYGLRRGGWLGLPEVAFERG